MSASREDTGMEALIDASEHEDKASEVSASSKAQKVQFDATRFYPAQFDQQEIQELMLNMLGELDQTRSL